MEFPREWLAIPAGAGVTITGLVLAVSNRYYASASGSLLPFDLGGVILFCGTLSTVLVGGWVLVTRPSNKHVLRLLAWWGSSMALTLFMSTTLLHHQSQAGVSLVTPSLVRVNSLSVGSMAGLLIGYFDTKARQNAVALAAEHDRLQREQEGLEVLSRVISHDIRNDMGVVLGWSDYLRESVDAEQREVVERIHTASEHVVELTELSRDYVAAIVDGETMETEPVDVGGVLRRELRNCREVYPNSTFTVRTDLPRDHVVANELLSSVIRNILTNAVQHSDSETPQIEVAVTQEDDCVRLAIADDGPGIPDDEKNVVFGKGELGVESAGTGTGLYLVSVLVGAYGGSVWVEDNDPSGAVVVVELRRALDDRELPARSRGSSRGVA